LAHGFDVFPPPLAKQKLRCASTSFKTFYGQFKSWWLLTSFSITWL
jgi:hypothetical protein